MNYGRFSPGVIFDGEKFLVIGGMTNGDEAVKNEVCTLEGSTMTCVEQSTALDEYKYIDSPKLFVVPENFGKDTSQC